MNNYPCDETWKEELSLTSKKGRQLGEVAEPSNRSRRSFLLKAGAAATVAVAARTLSLESTSNAQSSGGFSSACEIGPLGDAARAQACLNLRESVAQADFNQPLVSHPCNGDDSLYPDKYGSFTKALPHDTYGRVNLSAYQSLMNALSSGNPSDPTCRRIKVRGTATAVLLPRCSSGGSYLLSQAFSEGCPTHPSYPTGHGTVGGACVTVLKFFFNGSWTIPNPVMPSDDGLSLQPYSGPALTVNGELAKIAHNVSFGHGIHAGIHYRSDTDQSLLLGEAVALRVLQDRASCYNEKFSVSITKFDGTTATISN